MGGAGESGWGGDREGRGVSGWGGSVCWDEGAGDPFGGAGESVCLVCVRGDGRAGRAPQNTLLALLTTLPEVGRPSC